MFGEGRGVNGLKSIAAAAGLLALAGCATQYGEMGYAGGVSAQHIDAATVRVLASGNGFTSTAAVENFAMRKAAEETLASGYAYFELLDSENRSTVERSTTPATITTTVVGNSVYTRYTPGFDTSYFKPGRALIIRLYKEGEQPQRAFKASEVLSYMLQATQPDKKKQAGRAAMFILTGR